MIAQYFLFTIIFVMIDSIYLKTMSGFFNRQVKLIQGSQISMRPIATFLCYLLLSTGLFYFSILKKLTTYEAFLLGIFVYGVYETTNRAIFKKWKFSTVILDTLWGGLLFSSSTFLYKKLKFIV